MKHFATSACRFEAINEFYKPTLAKLEKLPSINKIMFDHGHASNTSLKMLSKVSASAVVFTFNN